MKIDTVMLTVCIILGVLDIALGAIIAYLVSTTQKLSQNSSEQTTAQMQDEEPAFLDDDTLEVAALSSASKPVYPKFTPSAFLFITIGILFFANPMFALFDVLPDFIGCALILFGLHTLSPIVLDFEDTFSKLRYMIPISLIRMFFAFASATGFDSVTMLSLSLVLGLVEFGIAFTFFTSLCEGLSSLSMKFNLNSPQSSELRFVGLLFFGVRALCSMLPYVTSVVQNDSDTLLPGHIEQVTDYSALLTMVNIVITTVFAVFFIITTVKHIGKLCANKEIKNAVIDSLNNKRAEKPDFFVRKNLTFALTLLAYSSLFLIDFISGLPIGGQNFIPDFGFGIIAIWAILLLRRQIKGWKAPLISGCVYTVLSTVSYFVYNDFLSRHYYTDFDLIISKFPQQYIFMLAFAIAETISLIVFAILLVGFLMPLATNFTIQRAPKEFRQLRKNTAADAIAMKKTIIGFGIFLTVIALMGTLMCSTLQMFDVGYDDIDFPYLLVHIIVHVIFYAFASTMFLRLKNGVKKRFETPEDI